ncbi:hypothetical protein DFA_10164 [Cavenderia fasciculata]|uniref:Uncharacterized protein n=1 Tax=Cavenderia fasciculata TaxID=261658 RepID=F4Q9G1_CACFS|nr:uncharacterized protein DFA_10164 [Cavenderia fasciculata]EGG15330.1 hypothetical protein DFA_10164 [Cavenderia fasciculata]|eukprot:XP_004352050.1 hypothetical protein DFA_10164 [Cavenderia fasciculata]
MSSRTYISQDGSVGNKNTSIWRVSAIPEFFWYLLNQITCFYQEHYID